MPITKTLTPDQALKRIADICVLQKANREAAEKLVKFSFDGLNSPEEGPNIKLHRNIVEGLTTALVEILDATDLNITIG
jgi:hypothetical protein